MFKDIYIIMIHKLFFQWEKWIVILQLLSKNNESTIVQQEDINSSSMNQGKSKGQTGDGKSEHRHCKNQRTKMDWNGWI